MFKFFGTVRTTVDPDVRVTPKGMTVTKARVAVNRESRDEAGVMQEVTDFWNVTLFNKSAESFGKLVQKGTKVVLTGDLTQDHWLDKETKKERSAPNLIVERWEFAESKKTEGDAGDRGAVGPGADSKVPF